MDTVSSGVELVSLASFCLSACTMLRGLVAAPQRLVRGLTQFPPTHCSAANAAPIADYLS